MSRKEVIGVSKSGGTHRCAEFTGSEWLLIDSHWSIKLPRKADEDGCILELIGNQNVSACLS